MRKALFNTIFVIIILLVLYMSISFLNDSKKEKRLKMYDITRNININDLKINVLYKEGNMIDETITYGNIYTKELEITNNNDTDITYSLSIKETNIDNDTLTYSLKASKDKENYTYINKNTNIITDMFLGYNLVIEANTKLYLSVEFKGNTNKTILKGIINIGDNLSEKDLFINNVNKIQSEINEKIEKINEITTPGYYLINLNELSSNIYEKYKGYVIINASDISSIKFIYFIYSNKYMLSNYTYDETLDKTSIQNKDKEISTLNNETVCSKVTKDECVNFNKLKYNKKGTKEDFLNNVNDIVSKAEKKDKSITGTIVYDVKTDIDESSKISGYILYNSEKNEYYLYLSNRVFMISGYNITKNGEIKLDGNTIRTYNETAYKLSSENKSTVCTFSGFTNCVDSNGKKI